MPKEPTLESFIDFSPENTFIDPVEGLRFQKHLKHEDKVERRKSLSSWQKIRKGLVKAATIATSILTPIAAANAADIYQNYEYAVHAEVGLDHVAPPLDPKNSNTGIYVFNGFNSVSAEPIVGTIGSAVQQAIDGQVINVDYNNAQLGSDTYPGKSAQIGIANINKIADLIRQDSKKNGIENVIIVTYSLGCVPGTMSAEDLTQNPKTSPLVKAIVYISCPPKFEDLQNKPQNEVNFIKAVSPLPGVAFSKLVRYGGEIYFLNQEYENGDPWQAITNAGTLIRNAINDVNRKDATGTWTIFDQALLIGQGEFDTRLHSIAVNTSDSLTPPVIDVRSAPSSSKPRNYDRVVNDVNSAKDMRMDAQKAPLPYLDYYVPGAVHGDPKESSKEFKQTFAAAKIAIQQALDLQEEIYNVKLIQHLSRQPITRIQK